MRYAEPLEMIRFTQKIRKASLFLALTLVAFVLLEGVAMFLYPGGTWGNRSSLGHDFFGNYFCDLTASKALNGKTNPGAPYAKAGMFVFTLGLIPFWILITGVLRQLRARLSKLILGLGSISSVAAALVPFVPSTQYGNLHPVLVFLAGIPGILAGGLSTYGLVKTKSGSRIPARLAVITVVLIAIDGVLYAVHVATGYEVHPIVLPGLQKMGAASLVAWMLSAAVLGRRR
ncbi:MAG TPA: hypothetical protein PKA58_02525 [Polyangium sp.]|nr:hypothetical protein [Polyangium sp.]